jgi:predicted transcriptional regulator
MATAARPLSVKLDLVVRFRIERLAEIRRRTTHGIVHEAIEKYVEREDKPKAGS